MSDQPKEQNPKKRAVRIREPEGTAPGPAKESSAARIESEAAAALARAVTSAEQATSPPVTDGKGESPAAVVPAWAPSAPANRNLAGRHGVSAAVALLALLGGWFGAQLAAQTPSEDGRWREAAQALHENHQTIAGLTGDVKALKSALDALHESVAGVRSDASTTQAELVERLERSERGPQQTLARVKEFGAQLDRIETAAKDPAAKLAALGERLDRIERQIAATAAARATLTPATAIPAGPVPVPAAPPAAQGSAAQTGSIEQKARDVPVEGWVLHEVYNGVALIESRNRRLVEVGPGEVVPGVGRVEAIERRGKRWVVVTAKGVIGSVQ
jgi:hypothetical protein